MSRISRWALVALMALSLSAAVVVGCSDDDSQQQQQEAMAEQPAQQDQQDQSAQQDQSQDRGAAAAQADQGQQQQQRMVSAEPLNIVVSTQVIADWVRQVGGDHVNVRALVPAGADAHTLELSVADIRDIVAADLVIINGATLEASYEDAILENADHILNLAEAIEDAGFELAPFSFLHDDEHGDDDAMHSDEHAAAVGRLLIADAIEAHLSVLDLSTEEVDSGIFDVAAPRATVYPSPTHRYGIVLARGPEDADDRVHVFDGGVFLVEHDDHYDLVSGPVTRNALEIAEERPIHFVNSFGWTAIFSDARGLVFMINEHDLANASGDYEPVVLDAGPQHGAALAISEDHVIVTTKNPDFPHDSNDSLPVGVEVRDFNDQVVYDASNRSCPGMHGETHNEHGVYFGCIGGVLFVEAHDGEYEHLFLTNPPEMREDSRIGSFAGHHHVDFVIGKASYFDGQGFADDGLWLIDAETGEFTQIFSEPSFRSAFSSDGELLYVLDAAGLLHALDPHDGDQLASLELVEPGEAGSPAMIVVGEMLYVADPNSGHVMAVHLDDMEIVEEWDIGGAPSSLAFLGVLDPDEAPEAGHDDHGDEDEHEDEEDHAQEEDDHGHAHGSEDPHFWFDTELAAAAITAIADELSHLSPDAEGVFGDRLDLYLAAIEDADAEVRALLDPLTDNQRLLVTFHDAFGYFARSYGLEVAGFVVEGPEQGISAGELSELIELIEHEGVTTVFHEPQFDATILDAVADETGAARGIIWSQPTDDNPTYIGILVGNAQAIAGQ